MIRQAKAREDLLKKRVVIWQVRLMPGRVGWEWDLDLARFCLIGRRMCSVYHTPVLSATLKPLHIHFTSLFYIPVRHRRSSPDAHAATQFLAPGVGKGEEA